MSYYEGGLGATFPSNASSPATAALQRSLQRIGSLPGGEGSAGADGRIGPRTLTALTNAARVVGFTSAPYTSTSSSVSVPDALIAAINSFGEGASDNLIADIAANGPGTAALPGDKMVDPGSSEPIRPVVYAAVAAGALLTVGFVWWALRPAPVQANRRAGRRRARKASSGKRSSRRY